MSDLFTALALAMAIEGALYALFPEAMRKMLVRVLEMPPGNLRAMGIMAAAIGVGIVWLIRG